MTNCLPRAGRPAPWPMPNSESIMVAAPLLVMADDPGPGGGSPPPATWATERVSVIVPYYQARNKLDLTLAALLRQDYPQELTEIIVVDDGSDPPLTPADVPEGVRVVTQRRDGFGAARARNNGARAAAGSILVFVDGDMALSPNSLSAHAAWHHRARNLYTTLGDIRLVDDATVAVNDLDHTPYRPLKHLADLRQRVRRQGPVRNNPDALKVPPGPNFAVRRDSYWHAGGQSEKFRHWGLEDTHFLYRAYAHGLSVVLVAEAYGLHLGVPTNRLFHTSGALAEQLLPLPQFRKPGQKRSFLVPEYVVSIKSSNPEAILSSAFDVLETPPYDLKLRVDLSDIAAGEVDFVQQRLQYDHRVRIGPIDDSLDEFPDSPFHVRVRTDQVLKPGIVKRLRSRLGDFAGLTATDGVCCIEIIRGGLAHHRRRYPEHAAPDDLMGTMPVYRLVKKGARYDTRVPIDEPDAGRIAQTIRRARYIRDVEGSRRALIWLANLVRYQASRLGKENPNGQ